MLLCYKWYKDYSFVWIFQSERVKEVVNMVDKFVVLYGYKENVKSIEIKKKFQFQLMNVVLCSYVV